MGTSAGQPGTGSVPPGVAAFGRPAGTGEPPPQPSGGTGGQPAGSGVEQGQGGVDQAGQFDRGALNPVLRDMNPNQINELFGMLLTRAQGGNGAGGQQAEPARQPEPEVPPMDYREALDPSNEKFNPEAAFSHFVQRNYGPLMRDINSRSIKGLYGNFRNQIHDFQEYEAEIDRALSQRDPATLSERDVFGTYLTAKGLRQLRREQSERSQQAGKSTHPPSAPTGDKPLEEPLNDTDIEFARVMFPREADPVAKYREYKKKADGGSYEVNVPMGDQPAGGAR
jgi:hypothetical protein